MTRRSDDFSLNQPYRGLRPSAPRESEGDPDETVIIPEPTTEGEVIRMLRDSEKKSDEMFDTFLGKVFKMICGIMAILLIISIGTAAIAWIWRGII